MTKQFYYKVHQVLQSVTHCCYKVREGLQKVTVITKWDVTPRWRDPVYKIKRQFLQKVTIITKWDVTPRWRDPVYKIKRLSIRRCQYVISKT